MNWDTTGRLILELRQDADVAAIAGANPSESRVRVRGFEPDPHDVHSGAAGDPYRAFVVVSRLDNSRDHRVPVQRPRYVARCYGRTAEEASALAAAVSNAIHYIGPRVASNGLGIYASFHDAGGEQDRDPETRQPFVPIFIDLIATTQAVAA